MTPRFRWGWFAAVLLAAAVVIPMVASPAPGPVPGRQSGLLPAFVFNATRPGGHIVVGSPLPEVEVLPTANASPGATLGLDHLLEISPNASDPNHPTVLEEAAPETLAHFNSTIRLNGTPYINLIATLPVLPTDTKLWAKGLAVPPTSDLSQQAILDVNYSAATGADGSPGVIVSWTVSGWPWANPIGDELALEYVVQVNAGAGFETCASTPSADAPSATCAAQPLTPGQPVWNSAFTALKGSGPDGSIAWVSWGSQVGDSDASITSLTAGAYFEQAGIGALAIAAPAGGATSVTGSTLFLLSPGTVAGPVGLLVGSLPAYGGAAAVFAAAALAGALLSRRRDRAIARELAA